MADDVLPDRTKSDFYCSICQSHMNSWQVWELHVAGKRHQKNLKKAPGEAPSRVKHIKVEDELPEIQDTLNDHDGVLLGLSFMTERRSAVPDGENIYHCHLCQGSFSRMTVLDHLESIKHKMFFFKQRDPATFRAIEGMRNLSKPARESLVEDHARQWEKANGREIMEVELPKSADWHPPSKRRSYDYR